MARDFPGLRVYWQQTGDTLKMKSEQTTSAPDVTSLFQVPFEMDVLIAGGERKRIRLMQNKNLEEFSIQVEGRMEDVIFDPDNYLLETSERNSGTSG